MAKVLLIAEHDGTSLNPNTGKCIACAASIAGAEIDVAVFAESAGAAELGAKLLAARFTRLTFFPSART